MVLNERITWKGLPRLDLNTLTNTSGATGFVPFDFQNDLDKVTKRNCSITFSDGYGSTFFPTPLTVNCQIKGRGNYTWTRPKHPFNLTLCGTNNFTKMAQRLFGMSTDTDWSLLADYDDFTHGRDLLSSAIAYAVGQSWSSRMIKVELYVNGAYAGLYTFCEKVGLSTERINITKIKTTDISGAAVTGGYVLEGEDESYLATTDVHFMARQTGRAYTYKVPDPDAVVAVQNTYMSGVMDDFMYRLYTQSFSDMVNGYRAVVDINSMAQYFLVQDLIKNADGNSFYITKDRNGPLMGGPFWDAGLAFGLLESGAPSFSNDTYYGLIWEWYGKLMTDPAFLAIVKSTLTTALPKLHQALADYTIFAASLRGNVTRDDAGHDAIDRDYLRWQINDHDYPGNYDRNVPNMIAFMKRRLYWQQRVFYFQPIPKTASVKT